MAINPYLNFETSSDFRVFDFESVGKTILKKRAVFDLVDEAVQLYNLALCTVLPDASEDYSTESKNGDMDTVLETVAIIAKVYSDKFPDRKIFFGGSNDVRSRKYQMGVNKYMTTLIKFFHIDGVMLDSNQNITSIEAFQVGTNYNAMIFTRKED
jgi:hypothetical protein